MTGTATPARSDLLQATPAEVAPFLRWAGSKRRLLSQIVPLLPSEYDRYIEPFAGSGALFLRLAPKIAILNDACEPLIETWRAVRDDPDGVWEAATRRPLNSEQYYLARAERPLTAVERAGRFIYLNRGAFNGLYRVNKSGAFNVPWGAPKTANIIEKTHLQAVAQLIASSSAEFHSGDFESQVAQAGAGDLVFVDPPYVTGHNNNGFIAYNESIFSWSDQIRLAGSIRAASSRGADVFVSNAKHPAVVELYSGLDVATLTRPSTIAAASNKRGRVEEVLMYKVNSEMSRG